MKVSRSLSFLLSLGLMSSEAYAGQNIPAYNDKPIRALITGNTATIAGNTATITGNTAAIAQVSAKTWNRAPTSLDVTYPIGQLWGANGHAWVLNNLFPTASGNVAEWVDITNGMLPGDAIGYYVTGATVSAGGSGYTNGQIIAFPASGLQATATVASGAITALTFTQPIYRSNTAPVAAQSTFLQNGGSGTGATFTLTFAAPSVYSMGRMFAGYSGTFGTASSRTNNFPSIAVPQVNGAPDWSTTDALFASQPVTDERMLAVPDQNAVSAFPLAAPVGGAPVVMPSRQFNFARSLIFDAMLGVADVESTPGSSTTYLSNTTLAVPVAHTLVWLGGVDCHACNPNSLLDAGLMNVGGSAAGAHVIDNSWSTGFVYAKSNSQSVSMNVPGFDAPNLFVSSTNGTTMTNNVMGLQTTATLTTASAALTGVLIGANYNVNSGGSDMLFGAVVPWVMTAAMIQFLQASVVVTFNLHPQAQNVIVWNGDSRSNGYSVRGNQSLAHTVMADLNRPDINTSILSHTGSDITEETASFSSHVASWAAYTGTKVEVEYGGRTTANVTPTTTAAQLYAFMQTHAQTVHAAGFKLVCIAGPLTNSVVSGTTVAFVDGILQGYNSLILSNAGKTTSDCDVAVNLAAANVVNNPGVFATRPAGPYLADGLHMDTAGVYGQAAAVYSAIAPLFPN